MRVRRCGVLFFLVGFNYFDIVEIIMGGEMQGRRVPDPRSADTLEGRSENSDAGLSTHFASPREFFYCFHPLFLLFEIDCGNNG